MRSRAAESPAPADAGLKRHQSARILAAGHALVQHLRCGHYDIATGVPGHHRLRVAFDDLASTI
jgi:transposase, IS6 family